LQTKPHEAFATWASAHEKPYYAAAGPCDGSQECSQRFAVFQDNIAFIEEQQKLQPEIEVDLIAWGSCHHACGGRSFDPLLIYLLFPIRPLHSFP
jgi:hypothetical protein